MWYAKNLPAGERLVRLVLAAAIAGGALLVAPVLLKAALVASGAGLALTSLVGWCPMCAMAGRRLE